MNFILGLLITTALILQIISISAADIYNSYHELDKHKSMKQDYKFNSSTISFRLGDQILGDDEGKIVRLVDYDNDGDQDVALKNGYFSGAKTVITLWTNNGEGVFSRKMSEPDLGDLMIEDIVFGDLDSDGDADMFVTTRDYAVVMLNDGKGYYCKTSQQLGKGSASATARLADLDGDSDLDAFVISPAFYQDINDAEKKTIKVYLNDGKGSFNDSGQAFGGGVMAACSLGDIDGNGTIDAVTTGWYIKNDTSTPCPNQIWLNNGSGIFTPKLQTLHLGQEHIAWNALADIDNDNDLDLILLHAGKNGGRILFNDGTGTFTEMQTLAHDNTGCFVPADMDNDGDLDLVGAGFGFGHGNPSSTVWINDGKGTFKDSELRLGKYSTANLAIGDLDGDGDKDIIFTNLKFPGNGIGTAPNTIWFNELYKK